MALIDCPECGGQVSDRAPTCPHCGVPIAGVTSAATAPADVSPELHPQTDSNVARESDTSQDATDTSTFETVRPYRFTLAGRPIPVGFLLFWGGMLVGMIFTHGFPPEPDAEREYWRYIPWFMIWGGVLWFAVNEFIALMRGHMRRRQRDGY